ncbi:MAG: ATP-dependent helicase [Natrialbaceae archaeon]|nr:ATP-dependent helicase [Natrialbaceae archaeon]
MTDVDPNPGQQRVIDARSGIHVVDAGAGTGKTFTITRRYAALLEDGHDPEDILLVTFTNNAAEEAKERVMRTGVASQSELRDAPINTFHSFCHDLLSRFGVDAPQLIGIEDRITDSTTILENEVIERDRFQTFLGEFLEAHPEHHDHYRLLWDPSALLNLITQLAAKGIFPTANGWYRNGETYLEGDRATFLECFEAANEPNEGSNGPIQSDLTNTLSGYDRNYTLPPGAPSEYELRGDGTSIDPSWGPTAFDEDREALTAFVHDVYLEYIAFALRHNYITFPFLQLFAFVLLCEDHAVREAVRFEHVMVDEFQDTSEIQFKLALLLAETNTLCAVGDWKQSIYGFQYAAVENIRQFDDRLEQFAAELNADHERIEYPVDDVTHLSLRQNYRSTQSILDLSEHSLTVPATDSDAVDPAIADEITSLESTADHDESIIEGFRSDEEQDAILERITTIVDNERYALDDGLPSYGDIAVLTRNRRFGRELQARARAVGLPMAYQGGVQLYDTDQALCCLAWLRILVDPDSDRGWAVVLEQAGYRLDELRHIMQTGAYPEDMLAFREQLLAHESLGAVARAVMDRYGFEDAYADAVVSVVESAHETTGGTTGDVVRFFEASLEQEADYEVSDSPGGDAVTVQTIHSAKGLQYPIVIVADINRHHFPSSGGGGGAPIRYQDPLGLRQTKVYSDAHGMPHVYDNWRYRVLSACLRLRVRRGASAALRCDDAGRAPPAVFGRRRAESVPRGAAGSGRGQGPCGAGDGPPNDRAGHPADQRLGPRPTHRAVTALAHGRQRVRECRGRPWHGLWK